MFAFIEGKIETSQPLSVVVNANGIGYQIHIPLSSSSSLPPVGNPTRLYTQLVVREDSHTLYGFLTQKEKAAFVALTEKVSGIGPKIALNILSRISVDSLYTAVSSGDVALLTQCPGIGKKTAERLILELKDVFAKSIQTFPGLGEAITDPSSKPGSVEEDAVAALVTLGFKPADAQKKIAKIRTASGGDALAVEQLIKMALSS